jgi:hypothetical protein
MRFRLIARKDGSSASRRARRFPDMAAVDRAIARWRADGFNTWWLFDGDVVTRQWNAAPAPATSPARDDEAAE